MKKMLYLCRPNLGENLFATPCWELLSREYDIYPLLKPHTAAAFEDYSFIKKIIFHDKDVIQKIQSIFDDDNCCYAYHHDEDAAFMTNNPTLSYIPSYRVLSDKDILNTMKINWISRTRKYMLKLRLMTLEQTSNFDCTVRTPNYDPPVVPSNNIIIYQGSKEFFRKLPTSTIQKFVKYIPSATYFVTQETANELKFDQNNIKYFPTHPFTDENLNNIIQELSSKPKYMIGPDSGLTQLASAYKIPLIWLQSRININAVIDIQYNEFYRLYKRKLLTCAQDCSGCKAIIDNIYNSHGVFNVHGQTGWKQLKCQFDPVPNCLDYDDVEIQEILSMIPS